MKASDLTSGTMDMENIELAVEVPNTKYIYTNTNTNTQIHEGHVYCIQTTMNQRCTWQTTQMFLALKLENNSATAAAVTFVLEGCISRQVSGD